MISYLKRSNFTISCSPRRWLTLPGETPQPLVQRIRAHTDKQVRIPGSRRCPLPLGCLLKRSLQCIHRSNPCLRVPLTHLPPSSHLYRTRLGTTPSHSLLNPHKPWTRQHSKPHPIKDTHRRRHPHTFLQAPHNKELTLLLISEISHRCDKE